MAVFKRKRGGKDGKAEADGVWTVQVTDHTDVRRRLPGFASRSASAELERNIRKLISIRQAGGSPDAESNRFLETAPAVVRDKLAAWGVIEGARAAAGKALTAHIEDWREAMTAGGLTKKQIVANGNKVSTIAGDCGWRFISDISAVGMNRWRNERRTEGLSAMTLNHYLVVAKTFCNWLVKEKRLSENPLAHLSRLNAAADRRIERRAFTVEELGMILAAAEAGQETHGMPGPLRSLLYRTAVETGLRWSELKSLTRASFAFDADPATVIVRAEDAKNGIEDTITLRPKLAADLKAHMALFLPGAKAFPGMGDRGAEMLRVDLESAGVPYVDEYGRYGDFHAFRGTFATLGAKSGIPLAVMQRLMQHSTPTLTSNFYSFIMTTDKADALAKLPRIEAVTPTDVAAAKTGTDDVPLFLQVGNATDTSTDTPAMELDGETWSCMESSKEENDLVGAGARNEKSPCATGGNDWRRERDSSLPATPYPSIC